MASKTKPCTRGPKHQWAFVKNVKTGSASFGPGGTTVRLSLRGVYKCPCGATKYGDSQGGSL